MTDVSWHQLSRPVVRLKASFWAIQAKSFSIQRCFSLSFFCSTFSHEDGWWCYIRWKGGDEGYNKLWQGVRMRCKTDLYNTMSVVWYITFNYLGILEARSFYLTGSLSRVTSSTWLGAWKFDQRLYANACHDRVKRVCFYESPESCCHPLELVAFSWPSPGSGGSSWGSPSGSGCLVWELRSQVDPNSCPSFESVDAAPPRRTACDARWPCRGSGFASSTCQSTAFSPQGFVWRQWEPRLWKEHWNRFGWIIIS